MKVLIVDADRANAKVVAAKLKGMKLSCDTVGNGRDGLQALAKRIYGIAVIDTDLPAISGLELIRRTRDRGIRTPIIVTGAHSQAGDRICGLNLGADDYLSKPYSLSELAARVQAILRRSRMTLHDHLITVRDLTVDTLERRAFRGKRLLVLTPREYAILEYLIRNAHRTVTVDMLMQEAWQCNVPPRTTIVETRLCLLRKKLRLGGEDEIIHTIRGFGYTIR